MGNQQSELNNSTTTPRHSYVMGDSELVKALQNRNRYSQKPVPMTPGNMTNRSVNSVNVTNFKSDKLVRQVSNDGSESHKRCDTVIHDLPPLDLRSISLPNNEGLLRSMSHSERIDNGKANTSRDYRMQLKGENSEKNELSTTPDQIEVGMCKFSNLFYYKF